VVSVQGYLAVDRELSSAALSRRSAVAQLAATTLAEKFARLVDLAVSLATRVRFRELVDEGKWTEAGAILREVPRDFPFIERLFLADVGGTLMADMPQVAAVRGTNFAFREWYQGVRAEWRPYVSPVYKRTVAPQLNVFAVAVPIRNSAANVSGILVLQVRVESLLEWIKGIEIGPEGFVYVVDSNGQIAFDSRYPGWAEVVDSSTRAVTRKLRSGGHGVEVAFDPFENEDAVAAYAGVAGYGWGVVAQQPAHAAFLAKNQQLMRLVVAYSLIALLSLLALFLASRIVLQRRQAVDDRRMKAELERMVAERTAQLEAANKELESFSYSVSHDLRSPLRAIDGFARIFEEDYGGKLDDEGKRVLKVIRDNGRKMGRLIDDLLAFSRLGRKPIAAAAIDMTELARAVFAELSQGDGRARLDLDPVPAAWGDPALVKQVWVNLFSNALKFTGKRERPMIEVRSRPDGEHNAYCVKDNGAGFDMQYYDKLFGVFQRLHSPEEYPGTGVGLAIVQRVVSRHGGRVWAEGEEGKGAAFHFTLPRVEARVSLAKSGSSEGL
jgi:signal transduction histidine kinase